MKQKIFALAAALALCLALAGCTLSTPDTVGTVGEVEISSGLYLLAQYNAYQEAAGYAAEGQDASKPSSFLKQTITPGEDAAAQTVSDYVAQKTEESLRTFAAVETRFAELGGELTGELAAQADSYAQQLMDQYGDTYTANGIGLETLKLYERNLAKSAALLDLVYGPDGETPVSDAELIAHLNDAMVYGYYVTVPLYNTSTFAFADEDQKAEMLEQAAKVVDAYNERMAAGTSDAYTSFRTALGAYLPDVYGILDAEYSESSLASDLQSDLFTQSDFDGYFTEEAAAALKGLRFEEAAAVQYSEYALLIFLREDPVEQAGLDAVREAVLSDLKSQELTDALTACGETLELGLDSAATAKLPAKKIVK